MGKTYAATGRGPLQSAPVNTAVPTISGTATVGQTLTRTRGVWTGWPIPVISGQWIRGAATVIAGATGPTYVIQAADQTNTVKFQESALNDMSAAVVATSAPTGTIP